jgi:hypothetical protein
MSESPSKYAAGNTRQYAYDSGAAENLSDKAPRKRRATRWTDGEFYLCPIAWADKAKAVLTSADELILAFRIYRCWKLRPEGGVTITCSNLSLGLSGNRDSIAAKRGSCWISSRLLASSRDGHALQGNRLSYKS